MTLLSVMIVDDDDLMRAGLCAVLSSDETIDVVAEAADGRAAVQTAAQVVPDVILMDVRMPGLDGIAATRQIIAAAPAARILILTTFEDEDYVYEALTAGATGFLLKRTRPEQLIAAIHTVAGGESLLSPSVTRTVIDRMIQQPRRDPRAMRRLQALTPREREVLELVAHGLSNTEIADTLVVEESTVKTHMKRILGKLDLRDRVQAVILAYEAGLTRPGERLNAVAGRRGDQRQPVR
ncbi:response regulator transcription factor [Actinoallomurus sp. NPDC050550]|uniref:response regulator transcription factor n=1 Tax=Actinoallomurus sp. NPDC050550 TaxID=3154937 RepID=UPI0033E13B4F